MKEKAVGQRWSAQRLRRALDFPAVIQLRALVAAHWQLALIFGPILGLGVAYAAAHWFLCDDAFISFRYARNFAQGHGLVFNIGERVEGYTDFLWVLELGALFKLLSVPMPLGSLLLSCAYTLGTLWVVTLFARQTPFRRAVVWVVAGTWVLLLLNRNFATWTTSGLETRQFTFFVTLAVYLHGRAQRGFYRLVAASLCWAAAELTRPEGMLLFACAGFYLLCEMAYEREWRWHEIFGFVTPYVAVVGAHMLFRVLYYGDIFPNTYYAKHVRAWPMAGMAYLTSAFLEGGLYFALPMALVGALARSNRTRDYRHFLSFALIVPHAAYLINIGGDHFEFRMLDFWWPLLSVAGAEGVCVVGVAVRSLAERFGYDHPQLMARVAAGTTFTILLLYSTMLQFAQFCLTYDMTGRRETLGLNAPVTVSTFPAAFMLPFMQEISEPYRAALAFTSKHSVGLRWPEHRAFWRQQTDAFAAYAPYTDDLFPDDAVMAYPLIGVLGFSVGKLTIIDELGLTDRVVAHNTNTVPNKDRQLAHDRRPPAGYLQRRGVNLEVFPTSPYFLANQRYAIRLREDLWMPLNSARPGWLEQAFRSRGLWFQQFSHELDDNAVMIEGHSMAPVVKLGFFDGGKLDGWTREGSGLASLAHAPAKGQATIVGAVGDTFLNSFDATTLDQATGSMTSPAFKPHLGDFLTFLVGGGALPSTGVELLVGERVVNSWHGENTEVMHFAAQDLSAYAELECRVRVYDRTTEPWGHVIADHFMLVH